MTRRRKWIERGLALATAGLFVWGSLLLADWLRERKDLAAATPAPTSAAHSPAGLVPDPRMEPYLEPDVDFAGVRVEGFGKDRALFTAGGSTLPPEEVFGRVLERIERGVTRRTVAKAMRLGPSAAAALRMQAQVNRFPGGAFLVRLAPRTGRKRLELEPGAVMLAFDAGAHWQYVLFFFPHGLDLESYVDSFRPGPEILAPLGDAGRWLEPTLALGAGAGGPQAVLCRAKGEAGDAVRRTVARLKGRGWRHVHAVEGRPTEETHILRGPAGEVWIATEQAEVAGGLVTVMIGATS